MFGSYTRQGFLSPAECEAVKQLFPPLHRGVIENASKTTLRISHVSFLQTSQCSDVAAKVLEAMRRANDFLGDFDIVELETLQLAEYRGNEEGAYGWHLDIGPGPSSRRKLSASVQLSDPQTYSGGNLELWQTGVANRAQGTLIVFPSYLTHRVTPVTDGVRHSLVAWAIGERSYR